MPRRKNDILLKSAFEETFPDLLRFCFGDADDIFNMKKDCVFLDKELSELFPELEKQGGNRFFPDSHRDAGKSLSEKRKRRMDTSAC